MLRAEFVKMKRTTLFWMHILVPIVGTGIVLWYYKRLGALDMNVKSIGEFLEILSLAFPTLSGIVCTLGTEMEVDAGNMQVLLGGVAGKCRAGGVKLVALLLLGAMGTLLALGSYLVGIYLYSGESFSGELLLFTVESVFILLGTQIATYVIHFFVSLKWHKGVVIGAGIVESMLSALFLTGITFKENCPDVRNTKIVDIFQTIEEYTNDITVYDPWANPEKVKYEYGINIVTELPIGKKYDAVINAVAHKQFTDLDIRSLIVENGVVYDVKGTLPREVVDARL